MPTKKSVIKYRFWRSRSGTAVLRDRRDQTSVLMIMIIAPKID
jgi:hypothetical protein